MHNPTERCPDESSLLALIEGRISGERKAEFDPHLQRCPSCRAVVGAFARSSFAPSRGATLGRYVVLDKAGEGAMGVVYAAYDPELDRKVALKVLWARESGHGPPRERLLREAQALARLSHPNVVHVYDVGAFDEDVFVAMEFVQGATLSRWLEQRRRTWRDVLDAFLKAGRGLAAAHDAGLVHRDFKPDNVLVADDGRVLVTDFGLAKPSIEMVSRVRAGLHDVAGLSLAQTELLSASGLVAGTPAYMAPEQLTGRAVNARADQFSFCVALWQALFSERPFAGTTLRDLQHEILAGNVRPAPHAGVPAQLRRAIVRGLNANPDERYPSMGALLQALDRGATARRRHALVLASLLSVPMFLVLGLLGYRWKVVDAAQLCTGAEQRVEESWGPTQKRRVHDAFLATSTPMSAGAYQGVERVLDTYAKGWVSAQTGVCKATRVRGEQSDALLELRTACLDHRRQELGALVAVLSNADDQIVPRAVEAAYALPDLRECTKRQGGAGSDLGARDATGHAVEAFMPKLAEGQSLFRAGKYSDGLSVAVEATEQARRLGSRSLEGKALLLKGRLQRETGDVKAARETLTEALHVAEAAGDHERRALSLIELIPTVLTLQSAEEALRTAHHAQAVVDYLGGDALLRASLFSELGHVHTSRGRHGDALAAYARVLELREATLGADHPSVASALGYQSVALRHLGRYEESVARAQRALAIHERTLGREHPTTVDSLSLLGMSLHEQGHNQEALVVLERAVAVLEQIFGSEHPLLAASCSHLARVLDGLGRYREAVAYDTRVLAIAEKFSGPEHHDVAAAHGNLGNELAEVGRYTDALRHQEQALAINVKVYGPEHERVANALTNLANTLKTMNRFGEALPHYRRAAAIYAKALGPEHPRVAVPLANVGRVLLQKGEYSQALVSCSRALAIREKAFGLESPQLANILDCVGSAYIKLGKPAVALPVFERALRLRELSPTEPALLAMSRFALARALWTVGQDRPRAHALLRQARGDYARAEGPLSRKATKKVDLWLVQHGLAS